MARSERLDWWKRKGAVAVEIPAERFAEYSPVRDDLVWSHLSPGDFLAGIIVPNGDTKVLRIVTRDSTPEEMLHFQAFRMPVIVHGEEGDIPRDARETQPDLL